jgi:membrane protein CcdC involved in cytochrome C biogenesis
MFLQPQSITPVIIKVVPPPSQDLTVVNVILDALGLTGLITIAAFVVGLVFGVLLIWYKRWRDDREPPGAPGVRLDLSSH